MSDDQDAKDRALVGYKRPPAQHRFTKGRSGNPSGRPKGRTPAAARKLQRAEVDEIVVAEARRPITVWENNRAVKMPMIQAVLRSLEVLALKGDRRAQLELTKMVGRIDDKRFALLSNTFSAAIKYKRHWDEVFAEHDRLGLPRPEPLPHPSEVILNSKTMEVSYNGPMDKEEKAQWDFLIDERDRNLAKIQRLERQARSKRPPEDGWRERISQAQDLVDMTNAFIPDEATRRRPGFNLQRWREASVHHDRFERETRKWGKEKPAKRQDG